MGVKSTYEISREVAINVLKNHLNDATNDELAEMLEALPQSQFRNYYVKDKIDADDYDEFDRGRIIFAEWDF